MISTRYAPDPAVIFLNVFAAVLSLLYIVTASDTEVLKDQPSVNATLT